MIRKVVLDHNFMKSKMSCKSKITREKYDMSAREGSDCIFGKDIFRIRIYLTKFGKELRSQDVVALLQTLLAASDNEFSLMRIKDKLTTDEWPLQFILN